MLAEVFNFARQLDKALTLAEQALTLKPQRPLFALSEKAGAYELLRRYEDALALNQKVVAAIPDDFGTHLGLAIEYSELKRDAEARAEVKEMLRIFSRFSLALMKERFPVKDPATLQRQLSALRRVGLK